MNDRSSTTIVLSVDIGASLIKACYTINNESSSKRTNPIHLLQMGAEIISLPKDMIELDSDTPIFFPENNAWLKYTQKDSNVLVLGSCAKKYDAKKENQINEVKYENAVPKCLALLGLIFEKHNIKAKPKVVINLLIPFDEKSSKDLIEKSLRTRIKSFYFRNERIMAQLIDFKCLFEGAGALHYRVNSQGEQWFRKNRIGVLMVGHRNSSAFLFDNSNRSKASTVRLGFHDFLKDIQDNTIGQVFADLEYLIPKLGNIEDENSREIASSLIRGNRKANQKQELEQIASAIKNSRKKFEYALFAWLDGQLSSYLSEIVVLGGTAHYFLPELQEKYQWTDFYYGKEQIQEMISLFPKEEKSLLIRFLDVYGIHKILS